MSAGTLKIVVLLAFFILIATLIIIIQNDRKITELDLKRINLNLISPQKRHVFFDLGANIGDSIRHFVDKDLKNEGIKGYGAKDNIKWELYIIEANPFFNAKLDETKVYCEKLGHTVNLYKETAAWIRDEKLTFYLDTVNPSVNYWGSSLIKDHPDVKKSNYKSITVNGIDISNLLSKYNSNDEIIMKIDIEGSEYKLLIHLLNQGTLNLVDTIAVEFHAYLQKDVPYENLADFFKNYFKIVNIKFVKWY